MTKLEEHALRFWKLMQKWRGSPFPVTQVYVRDIELPTLAAETPYPKLAARIHREVDTQDVA